MPEYPMTESILTSLSAQEPWPDNVKLYQPYEVEQILLPDNASCLAVQAFLKMCNLPFEVEMRWNAEYMSPSGRVPFIKCGAFVVSELEPIVQFVANKGVSLCSRLAAEDKAELRAYMSLISNVLLNAEACTLSVVNKMVNSWSALTQPSLYISWLDPDTFNTVTSVRNSSVYPWPLGWIQTRAKRNLVAKRLKALHWYDKTLDQVLADVEQCCNSLSQRLGDKDYFFGIPTPLDALIYGHMRALLSANGPKAALMIKPITSSLLRLVLRIANLTEMKLTPQEEYLILVSYRVCVRRRRSPDKRDRAARLRSRCSVRSSRDAINWNKDLFGFKPFQSKQLTLLMNKEGGITCEIGRRQYKNVTSINEDQINFAIDIIEDILDKVEEFTYTEKVGIEKNEHDFEVIAFPNQMEGSKFGSVDLQSKYDDYSELENCYPDPDIGDNLHVNVLDEAVIIDNDGHSDGLEIEKMLRAELVKPSIHDELNNFDSEFDSSNNNEHFDDSFLTIACHGDQSSLRNLSEKTESERLDNKSVKSVKSNVSTKISPASSASKHILKMPSNEEISVESLLKYLRKQNAAYNDYADVADID